MDNFPFILIIRFVGQKCLSCKYQSRWKLLRNIWKQARNSWNTHELILWRHGRQLLSMITWRLFQQLPWKRSNLCALSSVLGNIFQSCNICGNVLNWRWNLFPMFTCLILRNLGAYPHPPLREGDYIYQWWCYCFCFLVVINTKCCWIPIDNVNLDRHGCRRSATAAASRVETEPGGIFSFCAADVLSQYYWAACRFGLGFFFSAEPFLLLYRTKKIFWYKEMLLLRNMFHLYIVTKCYRLCKHEDDLCFQCNASLHLTPAQSPNTAQEAKTRRAQTSSCPRTPPFPTFPASMPPTWVQWWQEPAKLYKCTQITTKLHSRLNTGGWCLGKTADTGLAQVPDKETNVIISIFQIGDWSKDGITEQCCEPDKWHRSSLHGICQGPRTTGERISAAS